MWTFTCTITDADAARHDHQRADRDRPAVGRRRRSPTPTTATVEVIDPRISLTKTPDVAGRRPEPRHAGPRRQPGHDRHLRARRHQHRHRPAHRRDGHRPALHPVDRDRPDRSPSARRSRFTCTAVVTDDVIEHRPGRPALDSLGAGVAASASAEVHVLGADLDLAKVDAPVAYIDSPVTTTYTDLQQRRDELRGGRPDAVRHRPRRLLAARAGRRTSAATTTTSSSPARRGPTPAPTRSPTPWSRPGPDWSRTPSPSPASTGTARPSPRRRPTQVVAVVDPQIEVVKDADPTLVPAGRRPGHLHVHGHQRQPVRDDRRTTCSVVTVTDDKCSPLVGPDRRRRRRRARLHRRSRQPGRADLRGSGPTRARRRSRRPPRTPPPRGGSSSSTASPGPTRRPTPPTVEVEGPELTVDKSVAPTSYAVAGTVLDLHDHRRQHRQRPADRREVIDDDPACTPVTGPAGDVGVPGEIAPGEMWTYTCPRTVTQADVDAGSIINTASATGDRNGAAGRVQRGRRSPSPPSRAPTSSLDKTAVLARRRRRPRRPGRRRRHRRLHDHRHQHRQRHPDRRHRHRSDRRAAVLHAGPAGDPGPRRGAGLHRPPTSSPRPTSTPAPATTPPPRPRTRPRRPPTPSRWPCRPPRRSSSRRRRRRRPTTRSATSSPTVPRHQHRQRHPQPPVLGHRRPHDGHLPRHPPPARSPARRPADGPQPAARPSSAPPPTPSPRPTSTPARSPTPRSPPPPSTAARSPPHPTTRPSPRS